jgi:hypothetical protein
MNHFKTVPIMIDDHKNTFEFKMTRVTYFYIEAMEPSENIPLEQTELGMAILPLEFSGVICKPLGAGDYFKTAKQIEALFQTVEQYETLYVDSDNIWVPNDMFNKPPQRAEVYRVPFDLFARMYTLCRDDASGAAGKQKITSAAGLIKFSKNESFAFLDWTNGIVTEAIAAYPMNKSLALKWSD